MFFFYITCVNLKKKKQDIVTVVDPGVSIDFAEVLSVSFTFNTAF